MSRFKPYPEYKDSGVEWLGEVPKHWDIMRLRFLALLEAGQSPPSDEVLDGVAELPFLQGNADFGSVNPFPRYSCLTAPKYAQPGDILLSVRAPVGAMNVADRVYGIGRGLCAIRPLRRMHRRFLFHLIWSTREGLHAVATGSTYDAITSVQLGDHFGLAPPIREQEAIALFLDHETAKIDTLIAEQERLMELLQEKRQAVISHAVTKGLNPDAPMKDSGVEWVGEVPAHWDVIKIKYLVRELTQGWSPQCDEYPVVSATEWGVLKVGCVNGGVFNATENKRLPDDLQPDESLSIKQDDLLISRANTRLLVGSAALVEKDFPNLFLCDKLYRIRLNNRFVLPRLLAFYLSSSVVRRQIELNATGASASMLNISQSTVTDLAVPVPPLDEQAELCDFVRKILSKLDSMKMTADSVRRLLQERRSALISAAVTGKIDVRDWQPPEGESVDVSVSSEVV